MQHLALESLRDSRIVPIISPLYTALALIGDALSDDDRTSTPPQVRRELLAHLRRRDIAALLPIRTGEQPNGAGGRPNVIAPVLPGVSIDDALDAVRGTDPNRLQENINAAIDAGHPAAGWRPVAREPSRWLRAYTDAVQRAWAVLEPLWSRSVELIDRDVERVSVAIAHGALPELIIQSYPYASIAGDDLLLPSHSDRSGRVRPADTVVLLPLLAPTPSSGWMDDYADLCLAIRYSVPGTWRAFEGTQPPPASLSALVGPQRAKILRRLDSPATAGELADMLHGAPSMVTHHLRTLEAAGLIRRTRDGRHIWVHRSARGTQLTVMYERD